MNRYALTHKVHFPDPKPGQRWNHRSIHGFLLFLDAVEDGYVYYPRNGMDGNGWRSRVTIGDLWRIYEFVGYEESPQDHKSNYTYKTPWEKSL